jgi:hypothetical protein
MMATVTPMPSNDELLSDPFGERSPGRSCRRIGALGGDFEFRSDSPELLALVEAAYSGLPAYRLPGDAAGFQVELRLTEDDGLVGLEEPPPPRMLGGAGIFGTVLDGANLALAMPAARRGLVAISREMLRFPYHARYELIEFVVFTLASRAGGLVPLHAGCVGAGGRAALLVGDSGAGKSTLALHGMLQGLDFLAEDAVFVEPESLAAVGVPNFLHVRFDAPAFLDDPLLPSGFAARVRHSPVIRRRSGEQKYEIDLRQDGAALAQEAPTLLHIVFVSPEPAGRSDLLAPLPPDQMLPRLAASQPYAAGLPEWGRFAERVSGLHAHELRRGSHPRDAALALCALLEGRVMT